jgi:hypothetical protein
MKKKSAADKIKSLIRSHMQYVDSFKLEHRAFSVEYVREGKAYNCTTMQFMIGNDLDKKVKRILEGV